MAVSCQHASGMCLHASGVDTTPQLMKDLKGYLSENLPETHACVTVHQKDGIPLVVLLSMTPASKVVVARLCSRVCRH